MHMYVEYVLQIKLYRNVSETSYVHTIIANKNFIDKFVCKIVNGNIINSLKTFIVLYIYL